MNSIYIFFRRLFFIALLLNIAYLAWNFLMPGNEYYRNLPEQDNVELIVLSREMKESDMNETVNKAAVATIQQTAQTEDLPVVDTETTDHSESVEDKAVKAGSEKEVREPGPVESVAVTKTGDAAAVIAEDKAGELDSCFTLGPFIDKEKLQSLIAMIKPVAVLTGQRSQIEKRLTLHWVYIKSAATRQQAVETARRLKENNIKDFFIVREGGNNNSISLGYFKSKDHANRLEKKVKNLGFEVQIDPIYKNFAVYWLDYRLSDGGQIPESIIQDYNRDNEEQTITLLPVDCKS